MKLSAYTLMRVLEVPPFATFARARRCARLSLGAAMRCIKPKAHNEKLRCVTLTNAEKPRMLALRYRISQPSVRVLSTRGPRFQSGKKASSSLQQQQEPTARPTAQAEKA